MILRTVTLIITLALGILTAPLAADAQPPAKKIPRVGFLSSYPALSPFQEGFRRALGEMGYVAGQNLAIEWRWAEGKVERLPELAADLVRLKVDSASWVRGTYHLHGRK